MTSTQPSQLLASLLQHFDADQPLSVLDVGPALPETVSFFSHYRSKLFFADIFSELPIIAGEDSGPSLAQQIGDLLRFPADSQFDICLFWDLFNYLSSDAISAFLHTLQPCLHSASLAHGFAVHNINSPQGDQQYGIMQSDAFSVRHRAQPLPGYAPHNQGQLKGLLDCFSFDRTVLLPDSRLELLLCAR